MSELQKFVCFPCGQSWRDKYTFWRSYLSRCPVCGVLCEAYCDTQVYRDQREMDAAMIGAPSLALDSIGDERTEADLEAERDQIHDEIAEAIAAAESDMSEGDEDSDANGADAAGY